MGAMPCEPTTRRSQESWPAARAACRAASLRARGRRCSPHASASGPAGGALAGGGAGGGARRGGFGVEGAQVLAHRLGVGAVGVALAVEDAEARDVEVAGGAGAQLAGQGGVDVVVLAGLG